MKPHVRLVLTRPDGRRSEASIKGPAVTEDMLSAAEDLLHALTTGERRPLEDLYELCALAFGTTLSDAKKRLTGAAYRKAGAPVA